MYSRLILGALMTVVAPQQPETAEAPAQVEVPAIEVEVAIPDVQVVVDHRYGDEGYQDVDTDTTFDVGPDARLELRNYSGTINIRAWNRSQVRIEASHASGDRIKVYRAGPVVKVKSEARHGQPREVDFDVTIPATMPVDLWGLYTDVSVDGAENGVRVETLEGDIEIRACGGAIDLQSLQGDITLESGKGQLEVNNTESDITILDFEGPISIEAIDGDIQLEGIRSSSVEAKTVDGDIEYRGTIRDDGRYRLRTHDGDVVVAVPENVNATVVVATFDGEFEADFPVRLQGEQESRKFTFTLGKGGARLELHTFDGDIRLLRQ